MLAALVLISLSLTAYAQMVSVGPIIDAKCINGSPQCMPKNATGCSLDCCCRWCNSTTTTLAYCYGELDTCPDGAVTIGCRRKDGDDDDDTWRSLLAVGIVILIGAFAACMIYIRIKRGSERKERGMELRGEEEEEGTGVV